MIEERWKKCIAKGESDDQECRRQCWASAQIHEAHNMEMRSADPAERRRGCQVAGPAVKQRGKNGQSIGSVTKSVQQVEDKPWKNEGVKKLEEALPRLKRV